MLVIDTFQDKGFENKTEVLNRKSRLIFKNINGVIRKFKEVYTYTFDNTKGYMQKVIIDIMEVL